jgi:hypothetical protein
VWTTVCAAGLLAATADAAAVGAVLAMADTGVSTTPAPTRRATSDRRPGTNERREVDMRAVVIDDGSPVLHDRLPS